MQSILKLLGSLAKMGIGIAFALSVSSFQKLQRRIMIFFFYFCILTGNLLLDISDSIFYFCFGRFWILYEAERLPMLRTEQMLLYFCCSSFLKSSKESEISLLSSS